MKKTILYSHGFGVERDDRGLFTDIATALPSFRHVMFDYNLIDTERHQLTVQPIDVQAALLQKQYNELHEANEGVTLICHSQGCLVVALAQLPRVAKTVFITPAQTINVDAFLKKFVDRLNTVIDRNGVSTFGRKDGSTTIVPKQYLDSIERIDVEAAYHNLATRTELLVISAKDDEVLRKTNFDYLNDVARVTTLAGDHNFSDAKDRTAMVRMVSEFLR